MQVALTAVLLLALRCGAVAEKEPFAYAMIANACAPWDGLAIDLRLSSTPLKCDKGDVIELTVSFWRELPLHDDQTFALDGKSNWGGASYCKGGEQPCERATAGTIHIENFSRDKGASGTYELEFRKLGHVKGSFHAGWCSTRIMCR
jgi:hypothetical protein